MKYEFHQVTEVVTRTNLDLNLTSKETDWLHLMVDSFDPYDIDMPSDMALFQKELLEVLKR